MQKQSAVVEKISFEILPIQNWWISIDQSFNLNQKTNENTLFRIYRTKQGLHKVFSGPTPHRWVASDIPKMLQNVQERSEIRKRLKSYFATKSAPIKWCQCPKCQRNHALSTLIIFRTLSTACHFATISHGVLLISQKMRTKLVQSMSPVDGWYEWKFHKNKIKIQLNLWFVGNLFHNCQLQRHNIRKKFIYLRMWKHLRCHNNAIILH